ncbi:shikimate dehydrogenase [Cuneatibacter sp. NSJ-177]|uniref:shikimate dehydrogenase n=1 Tax=Cuneatibacter sp. NSJ-177 TaxID=2931401 RepID=UPI001FCFA752|nr:shikimate dehydrogenase [Cuneatibacter sp. NSJ-177]MCJ7836729.1 shikimate dehydrogenase [Cuneatibacter sp. NSJ-177]
MKTIGVNTKLASIIGTDIGHSKSPAMMNAAFEELGMDAYYFPMNIQEEDFGTVVKGLSKMNYMGLTITIPYKLEILSYLDEIDPLAKIIGAVNTVRIQDGKLKGFNTDGEGFVRGLEVDGGLIIADQTFLVIGAGGVSRAIMTVLASRRPKKIYLANRTVEKAEEICEKLNREVCPCCVPLPLDCNLEPFAAESTVLINATNIGMPPMEGKSPVDLSLLRPDLFVADVIYNPRRTLLLETAEKMGCRVVNGQSLLLHQGKIAFQIWTGKEAPVDVMARAVFG